MPLYLMPFDTYTSPAGTTYYYPRYFGLPRLGIQPAPELVGATYSALSYGLIPAGLVNAALTAEQDTWLSAQSNVARAPDDLEATLTAGQVTWLKARLNAVNVPSNWVTAGMTVRQFLRVLSGMFLYMQRVTTLVTTVNPNARNPFDAGVNLDMTLGSIPTLWRDAMQTAANEMDYDTSGFTGATMLDAFLTSMGQQWGQRPVYLGDVVI